MKTRYPDLEVRWRAFELRPEPVPLGNPNSELVQMAWIRSVQPLAGKFRVKMRLPKVRPRTRITHEAAAWARQYSRFESMHDAIFRAFFERSENIGDSEVLAGLATSIGLDQADLRVSLQNHTFLDEVLTDQLRAQQLGITGVPAFVLGDRAVVGVQSKKTLEQFLASV